MITLRKWLTSTYFNSFNFKLHFKYLTNFFLAFCGHAGFNYSKFVNLLLPLRLFSCNLYDKYTRFKTCLSQYQEMLFLRLALRWNIISFYPCGSKPYRWQSMMTDNFISVLKYCHNCTNLVHHNSQFYSFYACQRQDIRSVTSYLQLLIANQCCVVMF